jgi:hypothetical protein
VRPVRGQRRLAHTCGARDRRDDDGGALGRSALGRRGQDRIEAGQFRVASGEARHRRRQLRRDRRFRRSGPQRARRGGRFQRWILPQDGGFQIAQRLAGIDSQLLGKGGPQPLVGGERVGLAPAAVQRQHQLGVDLFIQRVLGHHLFQVGHQLRMLSGREPRLGQAPPDLLVQQVQPSRLFLQPGQSRDVRQRAPAPQRQRLAQVPGTARGISRLGALPQEPLGQLHIGAVITQVQNVAGRAGEDRGLAAQDTAQVRHVTLQRVQRGRRCGLAPHDIHQAVGADGLAVMQRQGGEDGLPPQAAHRPRPTVPHDINRPKQPYSHDGPRSPSLADLYSVTCGSRLGFDGSQHADTCPRRLGFRGSRTGASR